MAARTKELQAKQHREAYARKKPWFQTEEGRRYKRNQVLKKKYKLSADQYDELLQRQEERCACCGIHKNELSYKLLHVDHDHKTGKIRGLVCVSCNLLLGRIEKHEQRVKECYNYLLTHGAFSEGPPFAD